MNYLNFIFYPVIKEQQVLSPLLQTGPARRIWMHKHSFTLLLVHGRELRRVAHLYEVFSPGESHGQRSPVGYSPQGCKESDMTEVTQQEGWHERQENSILLLLKFCYFSYLGHNFFIYNLRAIVEYF